MGPPSSFLGHASICVALERGPREKKLAATMLAFPNFYGRKHKNANYFLDDLEMALLASRQDEDEVKLRAFPMLLKDEAKN